jgi:hypothetical protein
MTFTASSAAIHSSLTVKPKVKKENKEGRDGKEKVDDIFSIPMGTIMFVISSSIPFVAFFWALITRHIREDFSGILWCAAASNAMLAISVRISDLSTEIKMRGGPGDKKHSTLASTVSICVLAAMLGIGWTVGASLLTHTISSDLIVPISCLLLLCTKRNHLISDIHPVALAAGASSVWWLTSALYSIFIRGYAMRKGISHFELNVGIFGEENIGIWNSDSIWTPILSFTLMCVPLPAIALGFLRRKGESEDILFILALLSLLPVIAAGCSSIRLLGVMGVVFGSWRCYDVGQKVSDSNKLI